jgi:transposase
VLVLDNLRVYHLTGLREWLRQRGIEVLFLPPYSPDFTAIEQAWSKLKTKLRQAQARTYEALQEGLLSAIDWIISHDAKAWFNHCGYHVHLS